MVEQEVSRVAWSLPGSNAPSARLIYGVTVEDGLSHLTPGSVHCVVTSPPYWGLRDYSGGSEELGREATVGEYVDRLVAVFREVKRVLRTDGTVWLNLGDSHVTKADPVAGLKPKDVAGVPWRVASALQRDGWYLRAVVPWLKRNCLSGGTWLYVRSQKGDMPMTIKDVARLDPATVQLWNGERWTQIVSIWETERPDQTYEIEFRSGERVGCTGEHLWPTSRGLIAAKDLIMGDVVPVARLPEPEPPLEPVGLPPEEVGWFVGLYLAEGDHGRIIQLTIHRDEVALWEPRLRPLVERFHGTMKVYDKTKNGSDIHISSGVLQAILDLYLAGSTAHDKHLTNRCWQRNDVFLRALLEGYLDGDGCRNEKDQRWRLGFCNNDALARDLRVLGARLGYHVRLKRCKHKAFGKEYPGWRGQVKMAKRPNEFTRFPNKEEGEVVAVRQSRARKFWDLTVADEPHTFALSSGILTHNCMPESCVDRPSVGVESVFLLAHPDSGGSYYYDIHGSRVPLSRGTDIRLNQKSFSKQTGGEKDYSGGTNVNRSARRGVENLKARVEAGDTGRQRRCADWYFETLTNIVAGGQGLVVGEDGEPLGLVVNPVSYAGVHAAAYPPKLVEPMVLCSTSGHGVCSACGAPWRHVVERAGVRDGVEVSPTGKSGLRVKRAGWRTAPDPAVRADEWVPSCDCDAPVGRAVVLDPFSGSGTTGEVALRLGRMYVGVDLNESYLPLAVARIRGDEPPAGETTPVDDGGDTIMGMFGD